MKTIPLLILALSLTMLAACTTPPVPDTTTNTTPNTTDNTTTNTSADITATITMRIYGGFVPVEQAVQLLKIEKNTLTYTVFSGYGQVTHTTTKNIDEDAYAEIISVFQDNGFASFEDSYTTPEGMSIADAGIAEINYTLDEETKSVIIDPYVASYMPDKVQRVIKPLAEYFDELYREAFLPREAEIQFTYQPKQCEKLPWTDWVPEKTRWIQAPTESEVIMAYYAEEYNISLSGIEKVEQDIMVCQACDVCPTTYFYQASVLEEDVQPLKDLGWTTA